MNANRENRIIKDTQLVFMGKTLEKHYGKDALDHLVEYQSEKTKKRWENIAEETGRRDLSYLLCLFNKDAHDYDIVRNEPTCLEVKVQKCVHAEVFKEYNAQDIGEKLVCSGDFAVIAGFNPKIKLTRPSVAMTSDCCHFIFELDE